jgi:hypothetical protein
MLIRQEARYTKTFVAECCVLVLASRVYNKPVVPPISGSSGYRSFSQFSYPLHTIHNGLLHTRTNINYRFRECK